MDVEFLVIFVFAVVAAVTFVAAITPDDKDGNDEL